jgi:hypothetical protein
MAAEIVNLRRFRKGKVRSEREQRAAENRALHGRTKAERQREAMEKERAQREIEGARRDNGETGGKGGPGDERE